MNYKEVYDDMFKDENYNADELDSYRYNFALRFLESEGIGITNSGWLIDIGTGRGNFIKILRNKYGINIKIKTSDLEDYHNLDEEFIQMDLSSEWHRENFTKFQTPYIVTCLDCLEHLEEKIQDDVLKFFSENCYFCILSISNHSDIINGVELHLTRKDKAWWDSIIEKYFDILIPDSIDESTGINNEIVYCYILRTKSKKVRIV